MRSFYRLQIFAAYSRVVRASPCILPAPEIDGPLEGLSLVEQVDDAEVVLRKRNAESDIP